MFLYGRNSMSGEAVDAMLFDEAGLGAGSVSRLCLVGLEKKQSYTRSMAMRIVGIVMTRNRIQVMVSLRKLRVGPVKGYMMMNWWRQNRADERENVLRYCGQ